MFGRSQSLHFHPQKKVGRENENSFESEMTPISGENDYEIELIMVTLNIF